MEKLDEFHGSYLEVEVTETECQIRDTRDDRYRRTPCLFRFSVEMDVIRGKIEAFGTPKSNPQNILEKAFQSAIYIIILSPSHR